MISKEQLLTIIVDFLDFANRFVDNNPILLPAAIIYMFAFGIPFILDEILKSDS